MSEPSDDPIPEAVPGGPETDATTENDREMDQESLDNRLSANPPISKSDVSEQDNDQTAATEPVVPKKKRVYFPDDSNVVSGFMEPPSPWHDGEVLGLVVHFMWVVANQNRESEWANGV